MNGVIEGLDVGDEKKARKALVTLCVSKIVFSNLRFEENIANLGVVKIILDIEKINTLANYSIVLILFVFLIRSLPSLTETYGAMRRKRLEIKIKGDFDKFNDSWGINDYGPYDGSPSGEAQEISDQHKFLKAQLEHFLENLTLSVKFYVVVLVDYSVPVFLSLFALGAFNLPFLQMQ